MPTPQRRLSRGAIIGTAAATVAVLATGLIPVAAQVIGDPLGLISVGTSGESTNGQVLAVSNGGNASGSTTGVGVSTSGTASGGLVAASGTGCASTGSTFAFAPVAASGTGCASSGGSALSGTGSACGTGLVGASLTNGSCGFVAVSGTNQANGTYSADGDGEVRAEGQQLTVYTGYLEAPNSPDQILPADYVAANTPSASQLQSKYTLLAQLEPVVVSNLAGGVAAAPRAATSTANTCPNEYGCPVQSKTLTGSGFGGWWFEQPQQTGKTCGSASANEVLSNLYGEPDTEYQIADLDHGHDGAGPSQIYPVMNQLFKQHGSGFNWFSTEYVGNDPAKIMSIVTDDVYYGPYPSSHQGNGVLLGTKPDTLYWWKKWNLHSPQGHWMVAFGYNHASGGSLHVFDPFNFGYVYDNPRNANDSRTYGEWWVTINDMGVAMGAEYSGSVIW